MSSWHPTGRNRLGFVAKEYWPGGGEYGDGRDLYGVAECRPPLREETTEADEIAATLHPSDADYFDHMGEDEFDRELDDMETGADITISVNGEPLEEVLDALGDYPGGNGELPIGADTEMASPLHCTGDAACAVERFERDGVRQIGHRLSAYLAHWDWAFYRPIHWGSAPECWKRHRGTQYRPRETFSLEVFRLITNSVV